MKYFLVFMCVCVFGEARKLSNRLGPKTNNLPVSKRTLILELMVMKAQSDRIFYY